MRSAPRTILLVLTLNSGTACSAVGIALPTRPPSDARKAIIAHAQLWTRTNIRSMNLKRGPEGEGAFPFRATVVCDYLDEQLDGNSPKFSCRIGKDDKVKVKFGGANGEVYGEVLATRLLWALGFGADAMYPVNVICRGCPSGLGGIERPNGESRFDPAAIERKMPGRDWDEGGEGWAWTELDQIEAAAGAAPRAHRDALKLLAVFLQHTDTKPQQQRILCRDTDGGRGRDVCARPFLMINDLGLTFGRASRTNANATSGVNLRRWRETPVWKDGAACVGNLPRSLTGTLDNPVISEDGRRFLADLLGQLTDRQLHDLFEVARVELRLRDPNEAASGFATVEEWVEAFRLKRDQIRLRQCART